MIFIILLVLIILFILVKIGLEMNIHSIGFNSTKHTYKKNIEKHKIINYLTNKWNVDPYYYINDPSGSHKSMVFIHYFDLISDEIPFNQKNYFHLNNVFRFIPDFLSIKIPIRSVSFIALNKNIHYFTNNINKYVKPYGMIFDMTYENKNETLTKPLCFWLQDGNTIFKQNNGCSEKYGIQTSNFTNLIQYNYNELFNNVQEHIKNNIDNKKKFLSTKNKPMSFKQFLELNKDISKIDWKINEKYNINDLDLNNEVIFNVWSGAKIEETPIVAFFYNEYANKEEILSIGKIRDDCYKLTGNIIPVIKFNSTHKESPFTID